MKLFSHIGTRTAMLCMAVLLCAATAAAQGGHGGGGMGGGGGIGPGGGMGRGEMGPMGGNGSISRNTRVGSPPPNSSGSIASTNRGGLQVGPPGRWWNDKKFSKSLGLNPDQQKHMDNILAQNRDTLLSRYQSLQTAESRLENLTHAEHPDEASLFTEIDHVAQARAELEKANTHYLLQIRNEMTSSQIEKLEDQR